jgi:fermentation-respiration switch protein FrsA (DUF1100 family)
MYSAVEVNVRKFLKNLWSSKKVAWRVGRMSAMICIGLGAVVIFFEDKFIYYPAKYPEGDWTVGSQFPRDGQIIPEVEDAYFITGDGVKLHGWYCAPQRKTGNNLTPVSADVTILWFHGNAGNISDRKEMIVALLQLPAEIFIIDYRGYGRSEGSPSEEGLYLDAKAAWDYLMNERGIGAHRIMILGKSLGGVPAIELATRVEPAGLIVQSSFTSVPDMARTLIPFLPGVLFRTKMDSLSKVRKVSCPKLFIHSPADEVVPYEMGRRLYDAAPEPKQFYEVQAASHNSTWLVGGKSYLETLRGFVQSCTPPK